MTDLKITLLLSLADDEMILGHRLGEWTGWVPYIEEDLAMSSIAQDEMAHARALYTLVGAIDRRDLDTLALGRQPEEYRNAVICERPNIDFAYTLARHWLYDHADAVRMAALASSSDKDLREVTEIIRLEERYHLDHADAWFHRLADGPVDARGRFADALQAAFGEAMAVFEPLPGEEAIVAEGLLPRSNEDLLAEWLSVVGERLETAGLEQAFGGEGTPSGEMIPTSSGAIESTGEATTLLSVPGLIRREGAWAHEGGFVGAGGRHGAHSADFQALWDEMTGLYRAHPGATW